VNFYKRFMGDYAKDTSHLSLVEHGAYALLLDAQYAMEKGLPPAYADLYRICRAMTKLEQMTVAKVADDPRKKPSRNPVGYPVGFKTITQRKPSKNPGRKLAIAIARTLLHYVQEWSAHSRFCPTSPSR
jgi:hypothetical protein